MQPTRGNNGNTGTLYRFFLPRPIGTLPSSTRRRGVLGGDVLQMRTVPTPRNLNMGRGGFRHHRNYTSDPSTSGVPPTIVNVNGTLCHTRRGRQHARPPRRARRHQSTTNRLRRVVGIVRCRRRRYGNLRLNAIRPFFHRFFRANSPFLIRSIWRRGL